MPRSRSKLAILGLLAVVVVIGAVLVAMRASALDRHGDGGGPLGGTGEPFREGEAVQPRDGVASWTFGFELCNLDPNVPATIESIAPTQSVGAYRILGMGVRSFSPSATHTTLIGVEGFPAHVPDVLAAPSGYVVRTACTHDPAAPTTELLVGFGVQGTDGGGWLGIDVTYSSAGVRHVLHLDHDLVICGPAFKSKCAAVPAPVTS